MTNTEVVFRAIIEGVWNDSNVAMVDGWRHVCQCLAEPLPPKLHSLSLHVAADETAVRVHQGPTVPIRGSLEVVVFSPEERRS